ncbi:MAG: DUF1080 domain-containing protein [Phycisphaerae bacterium]|nr:DUF1080 domain-containing protein [Phycisphaerae bacterium]
MMKRIAQPVCVLALLIGAGRAAVAAGPEWANLIQGDTLTGWVQRGGAAKYRVEGGEIIGQTVPNTPNSFLCTERTYADFELELEFKVDPRLNSGVQIRSQSVPGYRAGVVHGYQVEIDPSARAWSGGIYDESRRDWLCSLEKNEPAQKAFKPGAWNHLRIVATGDSIKTWLNGVAAADLHDSLTQWGFIALQVHHTKETEPLEVRWRNLRIKDLGNPASQRPPDAIVLLDATTGLDAWQPAERPKELAKWKFAEGVLEVEPGTGNIVSRRALGDCWLHIEFSVDDNGKTGQANGNSGVYLQGRYEVQILNSAGQEPTDDNCGAIYKVKAPDYNMALPAGQWQTYEISFRAPRWNVAGEKTENAQLTVYHNGTRIHDRVTMPNSTGAGRPEGPGPAPLALQDHGNRIRFRNIWAVPLKEPETGR